MDWQNGIWSIVVQPRIGASPQLFVENLRTGYGEYPIYYDSPSSSVPIGYDRPEWIPAYVKRRLLRMARAAAAG